MAPGPEAGLAALLVTWGVTASPPGATGALRSFQPRHRTVISVIRYERVPAFKWKDCKVQFKYSTREGKPRFRHPPCGGDKGWRDPFRCLLVKQRITSRWDQCPRFH